MKHTVKILSLLVLFLTAVPLFSQEADTEKKKSKSLRFHSGIVLSAELLPENQAIPVKVINVSPFEPASKITSDAGYAAVVVKLDQGRSISVYDYSLVNDRKTEFKCIGVREGEDLFDANKWELANTSPDKLYTLLFKVELPKSSENCEYVLHFNLNKNISEDVLIPFVLIDRVFTPTVKIPADGTIGIDIVKEELIKAEEEKKKAETKAEADLKDVKEQPKTVNP
ncbi:MAG: hypothetical protein NT118_16480 [Lentisphaerae bacterium]|nr:hypothetical protein [Lentisphaerota bacterium]